MKESPGFHLHRLDRGKVNLKRYKVNLKHSVMKTLEKYFGVIAIAILGLLFIAYGVYSLATATSNIPSFRLVGLGPVLLGVVMLIVSPIAKSID